MIAASPKTAVDFHLSAGNEGAAPEGRKLLTHIGK
jgi:hypothetical protein